MSKVLVDVLNLGRARNYDTAVALASVGRLGRLYAGGYLTKWSLRAISQLADITQRSELLRWTQRSSPDLDDSLSRSILGHLFVTFLVRDHDRAFFLQRTIFSRTAGRASQSSVIIAEQTEALEAFQLASERGAKCYLLLTGQSPGGRSFWLDEEHKRWPPAGAISPACGDIPKLVQREIAEMRLATALLSPSNFVTNSLRYHPELDGKPVFRVTWPVWGNDLVRSEPKEGSTREPLHVLFVGALSLLKGAMYLVQALEKLTPGSFTAKFVGGGCLPATLMSRCTRVANVLGHVPYTQMQELYRWADVLVLPSLSEGRARVTIEAMSAGLPVIVTPNTGAPIEDGVDGIMIPPREPDAIVNALAHIMDDPSFYRTISQNAIIKSRQMTIDKYAQDLVAAIDNL